MFSIVVGAIGDSIDYDPDRGVKQLSRFKTDQDANLRPVASEERNYKPSSPGGYGGGVDGNVRPTTPTRDEIDTTPPPSKDD